MPGPGLQAILLHEEQRSRPAPVVKKYPSICSLLGSLESPVTSTKITIIIIPLSMCILGVGPVSLARLEAS